MSNLKERNKKVDPSVEDNTAVRDAAANGNVEG